MAASSSNTFHGSSSRELIAGGGDPMNHPYPPPQPLVAPPSSPPQQKKKKTTLPPGAPSKYPDAEIIALSPKTLMATNRFVCEVCNKGFQREQNLQLHRRGHNLPWKLKQKSNKDGVVKKKVYLCPEPGCAHNDPTRPLGDLTGIKKHYSRKHGEKKFKCEKCSKRYAVQSDWKAHSKTCGTREYRCDCGTLFSRRDSFITHRAFCDALAQESGRHPSSLTTLGSNLFGPTTIPNMSHGVNLTQTPNSTTDILRLGATTTARSGHFDHLLPGGSDTSFRPPSTNNFYLSDHHYQEAASGGSVAGGGGLTTNDNQTQGNTGIFSNKLFLGQIPDDFSGNSSNPYNYNNNFGFFSNDETNNNNNNNNNNSVCFGGLQMTQALFNNTCPSSGSPMSATALLQKAAQMGSTTSPNTASAVALLKGFQPSTTKPPPPPTPTPSAGFGGSFFGDQNNIHDLMTSLAGNCGPWDTGSFGSGVDNNNNNNPSKQEGSGCKDGRFDSNKRIFGPPSDRLTRDFLGVGEIVRSSMSGGFPSHREHQEGNNNNNNNDNDNNNNNGGATSSSQGCGGVSFQ